jgi:hypothetical protein
MTEDDFSIVNHYKEMGQFWVSYVVGDLEANLLCAPFSDGHPFPACYLVAIPLSPKRA